ncbi:hypothetical protein [Thermomicrobium sp.]
MFLQISEAARYPREAQVHSAREVGAEVIASLAVAKVGDNSMR